MRECTQSDALRRNLLVCSRFFQAQALPGVPKSPIQAVVEHKGVGFGCAVFGPFGQSFQSVRWDAFTLVTYPERVTRHGQLFSGLSLCREGDDGSENESEDLHFSLASITEIRSGDVSLHEA